MHAAASSALVAKASNALRENRAVAARWTGTDGPNRLNRSVRKPLRSATVVTARVAVYCLRSLSWRTLRLR